ncbi:MAG: hypothetical protein GY928_33835 [Colwellia sp.]|nr:hypothetical protein [Colwellia sp.]
MRNNPNKQKRIHQPAPPRQPPPSSRPESVSIPHPCPRPCPQPCPCPEPQSKPKRSSTPVRALLIIVSACALFTCCCVLISTPTSKPMPPSALPTVEVTPTSYISQDEQAYLDSLSVYMNALSLAWQGIADKFREVDKDSGLFFNQQWQADIRLYISAVRANVDGARRIVPPPSLVGAHGDLVKVMEQCKIGNDLLLAGINEASGDKIADGVSIIRDCYSQFDSVGAKIDEAIKK